MGDLGDEHDLSHHWTLDPAVTFLNHGSFGACPRAVLETQSELRARLEREPVRFFERELPPLLDAAREAVAAFAGADPEGVAFVRNATAGVNAVLRSLTLAPGDELLLTDHEYGATRNAACFVAERAGARVVTVAIPFPGTTREAVVDAFLGAVTPRTRLAIVDHITSPTGLVLPVERLVSALQERGVDVLVDGAHALGQVPLALDALGAAYYTSNCHKWLCAPKGAAILVVRADRRAGLHPTSISHGYTWPLGDRSRYRLEFDWTGTDDPTAALCVPRALEVVGGLVAGGWPAVMAHNRTLALSGRRLLAEALGVELPCPDALIGSLAALPLPPSRSAPPGPPHYLDPLQLRLADEWGVQVPIVAWPAHPERLVRVSAQLYNRRADYQRLATALTALLGHGAVARPSARA